MTPGTTTLANPPLLVSGDDLLVADVLRLAAAAGVEPEVLTDPVAALRPWPAAPRVLVGADVASSMSSVSPARRPHVHVVCRGAPPDALFREALCLGAQSVAPLPESETWLVEMLTDVGDGEGSSGTTIGVLGGSGGAGATVLAAVLALECAETVPTLLVDVDPMGPGADRVLGWEEQPGVRWDSLQHTSGRLSARSLREHLPRSGLLSVLTWPTDPSGRVQAHAAREVLSAGRRGFGAVIVDLPRATDDLVLELLSRCDHTVLVTTLTVPGVASATRVAGRIASAGPRRHLVTRGGGGGVHPADAASVLGLPLLSAMGHQRGLDEAISLGAGPVRSRRGPLARAGAEIAAALIPTPTAVRP